MKLHFDRNAFAVILNTIHERTGYRTDVLEKDYYVVLVLKELSEFQKNGLPAYFKGGTALYKALKTTNRFSEDIDLSVDTRNCTRSQNDKRLEKATKRYTVLQRVCDEGRTNRSEIISVYKYEPVTVYDANDSLQRFGKLKIEATSFTISEPVSSLKVSAMIYNLATDEEKEILESVYDVKPFSVMTITLERIFVDKLFAAESYIRTSDKANRAFEAAKHIYDLSVLEKHPQIISLLQDEEQLERLLEIRIKEEQNRLDGVPNLLPKDFIFFTNAEGNVAVRKAYEIMQSQYVMRDCDKIDFTLATESIKNIYNRLLLNPAWNKCNI
ncbi:MAG: nucleotidyl transferase AbiEii/AbiGii toxin family protein [Clostridia bacterium]